MRGSSRLCSSMHTIHERNEACSLGVRIVCGHIRGATTRSEWAVPSSKAPGEALGPTSTPLAGLRHRRGLNSGACPFLKDKIMLKRFVLAAVAVATQATGAQAGSDGGGGDRG